MPTCEDSGFKPREGPRTCIVKSKRLCRSSAKLRKLQRRIYDQLTRKAAAIAWRHVIVAGSDKVMDTNVKAKELTAKEKAMTKDC